MIIIKTKRKEEIISHFNTILRVCRYVEINKKNEKNMANSDSVNDLTIRVQ